MPTEQMLRNRYVFLIKIERQQSNGSSVHVCDCVKCESWWLMPQKTLDGSGLVDMSMYFVYTLDWLSRIIICNNNIKQSRRKGREKKNTINFRNQKIEIIIMLMSLFVSIKKETNDEDGGGGGARVDTRYSNDDDFVVVDFLRKSLSICGYPATKRRMQNSTCAQIIGQNVLSFPYLLILIWWPPRAKSTEEENNLLGAFFFLLRLIIVTECWWWLPSARSSVEWRRKKKSNPSVPIRFISILTEALDGKPYFRYQSAQLCRAKIRCCGRRSHFSHDTFTTKLCLCVKNTLCARAR